MWEGNINTTKKGASTACKNKISKQRPHHPEQGFNGPIDVKKVIQKCSEQNLNW